MLKRKLTMSVIVMVAAPSAMAERPLYYEACDGYGAPTKSGDGMSVPAGSLFGLISPHGSAGNTRRTTPPLGAAGIVACDKALADPRLLDLHWLRKANLLRARAIHAIAMKDEAAATRDLDAASAALKQPDDPNVRRTMAAGITLARAYLRRSAGDMPGAINMVSPLWADRPLNRRFGFGIRSALGGGDPVVNGEKLLLGLSRIEPRLIAVQYGIAFNRQDWRQTIALADQLPSDERAIDIGISSADEKIQIANNQLHSMKLMTEQRGALAYALIAMGNVDAARASLAETRQRIAAQTPARIPALAAGEKEGGRGRLARNINNALIATASNAEDRLQEWESFVTLRSNISHQEMASRMDSIRRLKTAPGAVVRDLIKTSQILTPSGLAAWPGVADTDDDTANLAALFDALPEAEITSRTPTFKKNDLLSTTGFKSKLGKIPGTVTVEFTSQRGSQLVVEELTLLHAAQLAHDAGKDALVVLKRRDYERILRNSYVPKPMPNGYITQIDVEFVDTKNLPERYKNATWRVLPVAQVMKLLGPAYLEAPATVQ